MGDVVQITREDGLAIVCLNRPEKKNAWTLEMFDMLAEASETLAGDQSLRAVILTGAGGSFSSGLDFSVFGEFATRLDEIKAEMLNPPDGNPSNRFQRPVTGWQHLRVPVIAAVEGVCYGAGFQLALAADFRISAPDASFSIMEAKWGLVPDMGISQGLPKLMRADRAKELMMTARVVAAPEALDLGLVSRLAGDPLAGARELAQSLMRQSPDALAAAKRLVEEAWCAQPEHALRLEAQLQADLMGSPNQMEAVMANMQKRPPKFR